MTPAEVLSDDLAVAASRLRANAEPFAFATIVRTAGATAAKPGARALIAADGTILQGFLGGGCTRGAVKRAALAAFETGQPQLISVAPEDELAAKGVAAGTNADGVTYARNGCPSRGTIDVFIEPCLPQPMMVVLGASPVAQAMAKLGPQFGWVVADAVPNDCGGRFTAIVIATQGQGDLPALKEAIAAQAQHISFVGSHRKYAALSDKLAAEGIDQDKIRSVRAPAGLDIGAVTPEEIALSIMAELTAVRRAVKSQVRA